jgi:hypothetical protein
MKTNAFLLSLLFLLMPPAMADIQYHGFTIDDQLLGDDDKARFASQSAPSVIAQLGMVEAAGLPPEILAFFKRTPILVDPNLRGNPGFFTVRGGAGAVQIQPIVFPANKPILLHELLHAYHFHVLSLQNKPIIDAYDLALRNDAYPAQFRKAHFLENAKEYFAVTATIFLFGPVQQPPFNCAVLSHSDPAYLAFLATTFGKHDCR